MCIRDRTGILTIMPCKAGTSIYYGNYINRKLTPFYGYYQVKDLSLIHIFLFTLLMVLTIRDSAQVHSVKG